MTAFARALRRFAIACGCAVVVSSCSGTPGTPFGSVVNSPGGGSPPPPISLVPVKLTVTIPAAGGALPNYVSPGTQSLTIGLISVDGAPVTGVNPSIVNTVAHAPGCRPGSGLACTAMISGSPGRDVFAVSTYAGTNATGALLSVGTAAAAIGAGGGSMHVSPALSLSIGGVIESLVLHVAPDYANRGKPSTANVALAAYDATGAQIVGPADYQSPIALSIAGDGIGAYALRNGKNSGESLQIVKPPTRIQLAYDGNVQAASVNLTATSGSAGAHAPFTLKGKGPPPPIGTIYVLNLGRHNGQAATVTEYAGTAAGNVAPVRTLNLDPALFARSVALDPSGNLYVGYFHDPNGAILTSKPYGPPDPKNVVAVYAPGASGHALPASILSADPKGQTLIYPSSLAFDAAGGLVTYGSTTVDGNAGNAVLSYAPGASGPAAPQHAFGTQFPTPQLIYPGPAGLALDAAGNVYLSGIFAVSLSQVYAILIFAAADIGNPNAPVGREIPWDSTTGIGRGRAIALDASAEIYQAFANTPASVCQGNTNVFSPGASGGLTDVPPLRALIFQGMTQPASSCLSNPLLAYFPEIAVYRSVLFASDAFHDAVTEYPAGADGTVSPTVTIAGSSTQLAAPIGVAISTSSDRAPARPVTHTLNPPRVR